MLYKDENYEFSYTEPEYSIKPHPYLEIVRFEIWEDIQKDIISIVKSKKIKLKSGNKGDKAVISNNLAMWIARNLSTEKKLKDPFFPYNAKHNNVLVENFIDTGKITEKKAKSLVEEINLPYRCNKAIKKMIADTNLPTNYYIKKIKDNLIYYDNKLERKVFCPDYIYKKMEKNYKGDGEKLNDYIFSVLLRYDTLGGRAHQFAMEPKFKDILRKNYNCYVECFASAINNYYPIFGSLFYDIEKPFGSIGSFYNVEYKRGFFIANPPYESELLLIMVKKFISSLEKSKDLLTISFGLPKWGEYRDFKALEIAEQSKYTKYYRCLNREVYWIDTLTNYRVIINEHCRFVIQNKDIDNLENFNILVDNYWVSKNLNKNTVNVETKLQRLVTNVNPESLGGVYYKEKIELMKIKILNIPFPYITNTFTKEKINEKIKIYQNNSYELNCEKKDKVLNFTNKVNIFNYNENLDYYDILFFFIENYLLNCLPTKSLRSMKKNYDLFGDYLYEEFKKNNKSDYRTFIYKKIDNCFVFNTEFNLAIIDKYKPKSILDYNMSFGDKFLASTIRDIKYLGFLEEDIENNLNDIINCYGNKNRQNIIYDVFNKYDLFEIKKILDKLNINRIDMIFTKLNEYDNMFYLDSNNLIKNYSSTKEKFILFDNYYNILKALNFISPKGHLILEITNNEYIEIISLFILNNFSYFNMQLEDIIYRGKNKYLVFAKKASIAVKNKKEIREYFQKKYEKLFIYSNNLINDKYMNSFFDNNIYIKKTKKEFIIRDSGINSSQNKTLLLSILSKPEYINKFMMYGSMQTAEIVLIFAKICKLLDLNSFWAINNQEYGWQTNNDNKIIYSQVLGKTLIKALEFGLQIENIISNNLYNSGIEILSQKLKSMYANNHNVYIFPFTILDNEFNILRNVISSYLNVELDYNKTFYMSVNTLDYIKSLSNIYKKAKFIILETGRWIKKELLDTNRIKIIRILDISDTYYSYNTGPPEIEKIAKDFDIEIFSAWIYKYYLKNKSEGDICLFYD